MIGCDVVGCVGWDSAGACAVFPAFAGIGFILIMGTFSFKLTYVGAFPSDCCVFVLHFMQAASF